MTYFLYLASHVDTTHNGSIFVDYNSVRKMNKRHPSYELKRLLEKESDSERNHDYGAILAIKNSPYSPKGFREIVTACRWHLGMGVTVQSKDGGLGWDIIPEDGGTAPIAKISTGFDYRKKTWVRITGDFLK